jgi:glycosyltransferase involved in cell wall biosynthesis
MKIAYIINHDITTNDGITKKILGQKKEWEKLGNKVVVYCTLPKNGNSILESKQYISTTPLKLRFQLQKDLLRDLESFTPDIVYFRYNTWSRTLSKVLDKYKVVTELNTYDLGEFWLMFKKEKTLKSLIRYLAYKLLRAKVLSKVIGIIGVTQEIAYHPSNLKYNKPTTFIPNGINLDEFKTLKNSKVDSSRIGLFFIGSPGAIWHGVDIIEEMAKNLPEYDFHIVGMDGDNSSNVFWHGYLQKKEYLKILMKCHIGIGSLALYRNKMNEACTLKVREYLAYGYPVILGYKDSAFIDKSQPQWIHVLDTQKEIDYDKMKKFILKNYKTVIEHAEIEYISTNILEVERVEFFQSRKEV